MLPRKPAHRVVISSPFIVILHDDFVTQHYT